MIKSKDEFGGVEYELTKAEQKLANVMGDEFWENNDYIDFDKMIPKIAKAVQAVMDERAAAAKVKPVRKGGKK